MNLLRASANRLSACGRALRPWLGRTLLPAAVLDPSGQASPAERQPCRMAGAGFTAARVLGRGRRRAWTVAGEQTGSTATILAKRRRNGRACGRQYLRSGICTCWVNRFSQDVRPRGEAFGNGRVQRGVCRALLVLGTASTTEISRWAIGSLSRG